VTVRVRLAPSPTGTLHIGTARTALFNWLFAKKNAGKFLLRIEDTDKERSKPEYLKNILEGLEWLNLKWDEELIIQSNRVNEHQNAIKYLLESGLAYRCYATEEELEEMRVNQKTQGKPPRYDNRSRKLTSSQEQKYIEEGRSSVIRFIIEENKIIEWSDPIRGTISWCGQDLGGDMVISRRTKGNEIGDPLYNLVVVVDDAAMQISHVIRGEDHISNTAKQILLYEALGLKKPSFIHTPLILNSEGKKLSKRDGVTSISDFRKLGYTSDSLTNYMTLLGWSLPDGINERFTLEEASKLFSFERVNKSGARFDWDKLNWINSQVIHEWSAGKLLQTLLPLWEEAGWKIPNKEWGISLSELIGPSLVTLKDGIDQATPFFETPILQNDAIKQLEIEGAKLALKSVLNQLEEKPLTGKDPDKAKELIQKTFDSTKVKKGIIMKSLRGALLGQLKGPDLIHTWCLLAQNGQDIPRLKKLFKTS
tara:strand:- start:1935 stop:3374 length:1440 start_codon:yes stop_codon:yes gene_type:complete